MPIARVDEIEIYFEEQGSGEPVLLIPASWWPSDTWKVGVVPVLSRRYRTIILDCRGTGRSSKPTDGYAVQQFAADALGLLNYLDVKRCHAVGFALGSLIVQAMAIARPDLVATLTMAAAGPGSKKLDGTPRDLSRETMREIHEMGFERYIRSHIDNDGMAYNPDFYREHRDRAAALADALWSGHPRWKCFVCMKPRG
jgi:pimeloyl-ACP methyl ester carboxylesterase